MGMKIIKVGVTTIIIISFVMFVWYITQPITLYSVEVTDTIMEDMDQNVTQWEQTKTVLDYIGAFWPVPFIIIAGLLLFMWAQRRDPESVVSY